MRRLSFWTLLCLVLLNGCGGQQPQHPLSGAPTPGTTAPASAPNAPGMPAAKKDPHAPPKYPVNLPPDYPTGR